MATVEKIKGYQVKSGDLFFFDNNVWMFLFSPISNVNESQQRIYANLLREIRATQATIFINSLVVSEYINSSLRLNFGHWKDRVSKQGNLTPDYKLHYRPTDDFKTGLIAIYEEMKEILSISERRPDDFNALDLNSLFTTKSMDFNDAYYANFCEKNSLILVTDDKDLQNTPLPIKILTA